MSRFRRELRYLVFKLKDIDRYLSPREWETLVSIENKIIAARDKERRPQLSTVVVERDWPEFEIVWGMIEARMLGVKNKYEVEIEEIQAELSEQCRLLGMSAERELKLIAERDQFRDGMLTLGTELRPIEAALDDERINLTHTAAQVAAEMRDKINELHAEIEATRKQEPVGTAFLCDRCKTPLDGAHFCPGCGWCMATEEPVYLAPGAPSVLDEIELLRTNAERYEWLRAQHRPVDLPIAQVVWKRNSDPHGEWVNLVDDNDLDRHIDAMLLLTDQGDK